MSPFLQKIIFNRWVGLFFLIGNVALSVINTAFAIKCYPGAESISHCIVAMACAWLASLELKDQLNGYYNNR